MKEMSFKAAIGPRDLKKLVSSVVDDNKYQDVVVAIQDGEFSCRCWHTGKACGIFLADVSGRGGFVMNGGQLTELAENRDNDILFQMQQDGRLRVDGKVLSSHRPYSARVASLSPRRELGKNDRKLVLDMGAVCAASHCMAKNDIRVFLNGIFVHERKGKHRIMSSDGHMAYVSKWMKGSLPKQPKTFDGPGRKVPGCILPGLVVSLCSKGKGGSLSLDGRVCWAGNGRINMRSGMIAGKYPAPQLDDITVKNAKATMRCKGNIHADELLKAMKDANAEIARSKKENPSDCLPRSVRVAFTRSRFVFAVEEVEPGSDSEIYVDPSLMVRAAASMAGEVDMSFHRLSKEAQDKENAMVMMKDKAGATAVLMALRTTDN